MSPAARRSAAVVVSGGPATEAGPLGLRAALALGAGGLDVTVVLVGDGALLARPLAATWLSGDPGADLDGLLDDLGARVVVDAAAVADGDGLSPRPRRGDIEVLATTAIGPLVAAADLVIGFGPG